MRTRRRLRFQLLPWVLVVTAAQLAAQPPPGGEADSTSIRPRKERRRLLDEAVSRANPIAAGEQTVDMVRWMAKRRSIEIAGVPYGITGLPMLYYSPNTGYNYGGRLQWADFQRRPYRYKITLHWLKSTKGRWVQYVKLQVPQVSGTGFGFRMVASTRRDLRARYYGLGNDSERNSKYTDPDSPLYKDENYYHYILEEPRAILSLLRRVYGPVSMSAGIGIESTDIDARGDSSYYKFDLRQGNLGNEGAAANAVTGFVSITVNWDTRDDPTIPRRGVFHEWSYESSRNSFLGLLFEEIDFRRYTFTDARYYALSKRLNLANRIIVEALKGTIPLHAYGEIGGSVRTKGAGGSDTLRGFDRQRFTDNIRVLTNTEVRYRLHSHRALKQYLEWHGVAFADLGQVGPGFAELKVLDTHMTGGLGLRLYWNADFVIRADLGLSAEQGYLGLKYRNIF